MLKNLLLLAASTLVALVVAEIGIRREWIPIPERVESSGWWKELWLRRGKGPVPKAFVQLDPELGWLPAANLEGVRLEGGIVGTNSVNMRGRREFPIERTGAPRIVAIGDSFTFGQCVNDADAFPAQLAERLDAEVLNLGVMGYGFSQALRRLELHGLAYQPDWVILGFFRSDVARTPLFFRDYGKPRYRLADDGGVVLDQDVLPVKTPEEYRALWPPRLLNYAIVARDAWFPKRRKAHARELTERILRRMREQSQAIGARFAIVYLPRAKALRGKNSISYKPLREICEGPDDLACISPLPRIRRELAGEDAEAHFRCHYSPRVNGIVADEIAEHLRAESPELFVSGAPEAGGG